jgi:glycosyltransferase involved in cell wall biosynthesis
LSGDSYILSRFYSPVFEEKLTQLLLSGNYDVVQLETVYLAHYIPAIRRCSRALVVMRAHNVEHEIWERVAKNTANPFKKWYLNLQNRALRRFELDHYRDYDLLLAITNRDLDVFRKTGYTGQAHVAPVGLDCSFYQPDFQCFLQKPALSFIGALDWMPNQEGVVWFLENVWPALLKTCPELEFHIAGKNTPAWLSANPPKQVFFHGETPSATDFLNRFPVMLAPLFSGSGIRIKILEGMALGRVVITTTLGKEGIPARHNEHLLLADSPDEFANAIRHFLNNRAEMQDLGRSARRFIEENFDAAVIGKSTLEAYRSLLSGRQS